MWYRTRLAVEFDQNSAWDPSDTRHQIHIYPPDDEYEDQYSNHADLVNGLNKGKLLVHARQPDNSDFSYGIDPSSGEFLQSTESWQNTADEYGDGPELTFFSNNLGWAKHPYNQLVFVRKHPAIQQSLGNGHVRLHDGTTSPYEMSPMADYESDLFKHEPAGVETNDWYTNENQPVVGTITRNMQI